MCKSSSGVLPALQGAEVHILAHSDLRDFKAMLRMTEDVVGLSESELGASLLDTGELSSCPVQASVLPGIRQHSNRPPVEG